MKIQRQVSRRYKGNDYFKYKVNIPSGAIERAQLNIGDDVLITSEPGEITLSKQDHNKQQFDGERSQLYKEALIEYPNARAEDLKIMKRILKPQKGEKILEIGAGSGFFSGHIADLLEEKGQLIVSDPSLDQLETVKNLKRNNIEVIQFVQFGSKKVNLEKDKVDAVWSFGAYHHMFQKSKSFANIKRILKKGGRIVIGDVFNGSALAKHFDEQVARYCNIGHEVAFWNKEYAKTLCAINGFSEPKFYDINIKWKFNTKKDIGIFLYKLHAMTKTTVKECQKGAEDILGVKKVRNQYELNWPMTIMIIKN
jgi:arsenite methyltransferase